MVFVGNPSKMSENFRLHNKRGFPGNLHLFGFSHEPTISIFPSDNKADPRPSSHGHFCRAAPRISDF